MDEEYAESSVLINGKGFSFLSFRFLGGLLINLDVVCFDLIFSEALAVKDVAVMLAVDAQVVYRSKKRIIQLLRHRKQLLVAN